MTEASRLIEITAAAAEAGVETIERFRRARSKTGTSDGRSYAIVRITHR